MGRNIKGQDILVVCLFLEALLVLIGLIMGWRVQIGIICYWAILAMKNFLDVLDGRQERGRRNQV